jgi:hypothetical protein
VQVGLFSPSALHSTPFDQVDLTGEIRSEQVCFLSHDDGIAQTFPGQELLVDDLLRSTIHRCFSPLTVISTFIVVMAGRRFLWSLRSCDGHCS